MTKNVLFRCRKNSGDEIKAAVVKITFWLGYIFSGSALIAI